jgi:hypothetical protein
LSSTSKCSGITSMSPAGAAASPTRRLSDDRVQLYAAGPVELEAKTP